MPLLWKPGGTLHSSVREVEKERFLIVSRFGEKASSGGPTQIGCKRQIASNIAPGVYIRNIQQRFLLFYGDFEEKQIEEPLFATLF